MLKLYNNLTRKIEKFESIEDGMVKMFTCGPSIYQRPHIGNYRTFIFEDILERYLEYQGYNVIKVLNFTDIEDKSISEAKKQNIDVLELTDKYGKMFFKEAGSLRIKPPAHNPRSSTSVDESVNLVRRLLEKGYAYWHNGNVYFDPGKFKDFGKLGRPDMSRWPQVKKRFHRDTYPGNYWNLGDFILWHGYKEGDNVYWETSIGKGRPAWNVQDPAMAVQTLGYSIDICCGGEDNLIRHHDYTIAVVESVSDRPLARFWLHGAHLLVNGKKMSKSKGNVVYIDDLLKAGYSGEDIRFYLIYGNYNKRLNCTSDKIKKTSEKLREVISMIDVIHHSSGKNSDNAVKDLTVKLKDDFEKNMDNDLNVKQAFNEMMGTLNKLARLSGKNRVTAGDAEAIMVVLTGIDSVLQVSGLAEP